MSDYYAMEQSGQWWGDGAKSIGLVGVVRDESFKQLLMGRKQTGETLIKPFQARTPRRCSVKSNAPVGATHEDVVPMFRRSAPSPSEANSARHLANSEKDPTEEKAVPGKEVRTSRPGFDVTFSVPKSVSVLWATSTEVDQRTIEAIVRHSVWDTLGLLQSTVPLIRRGLGGKDRELAKLAAATFLHITNRDLDPQLHVHSVLANLAKSHDGKWFHLNGHLLHQWTPALGRVFRCNLACALQRELGLEFVRPDGPQARRESWFEIKGVPTELIDRWSSRRNAIDQQLDGRTRQRGHSAAKVRQAANLATRKQKIKQPQLSALIDEWRREAKKCGFKPEQVPRHGRSTDAVALEEAYHESLRSALKTLTVQNSHFADREVVLRVCEDLQHRGLEGKPIVERVLHDLNHSPGIVPLNTYRGERRYTTREMWNLEERLIDEVSRLKSRSGALVNERVVSSAISNRPSLNPEQQKAARYLMTKRQSIRILHGTAGSGKSYTLDAVRDGFERAGYQVMGGALAGAAARELNRQAEITSRTVASYLWHLDRSLPQVFADRLKHDLRQLLRAIADKPTYRRGKIALTKKTVLILDEAGMLDTRTMERLVYHVERVGATLILAGDFKQLPPILAGGPMGRLARHVGSESLVRNQRQADASDRRAVADLRSGLVEEALRNYAQRGRVTIGSNWRETLIQLVESWSREGGCRRPADHMILTQTRADADDLNRLCQRKRLESYRTVPLLFLSRNGVRYHIGDRILFHQSMRALGIENGFRGTVIAVDPILRRLKIRLDHTPLVLGRRKSRIVTISMWDIPKDAISLGYAATTHKLQGQTVDHSYVLLGGSLTGREMTYVQATRARKSTRFFVEDLHAGKDLVDLIESARRSQAKDLAHDVGKSQVKTRGRSIERPEL